MFCPTDKLKCLTSYNRPSKDTKKVESSSKPLQLGLSLVNCNTEISLLACIESKFSTFFIFKNVRKIKKYKKRKKVTRIKNVKTFFYIYVRDESLMIKSYRNLRILYFTLLTYTLLNFLMVAVLICRTYDHKKTTVIQSRVCKNEVNSLQTCKFVSFLVRKV